MHWPQPCKAKWSVRKGSPRRWGLGQGAPWRREGVVRGAVLRLPFNGLRFNNATTPNDTSTWRLGDSAAGWGPQRHVGEPSRPLLPGKPTPSPAPQHRVQQGGGGAQESGHMEAQAGGRGLASASSQAPTSGPQATPLEVLLEQMGGPGVRGWGAGQGGRCADHPGGRGCPHMLVLIRDWLLAGVSSPWLPSRGGDCSGDSHLAQRGTCAHPIPPTPGPPCPHLDVDLVA